MADFDDFEGLDFEPDFSDDEEKKEPKVIKAEVIPTSNLKETIVQNTDDVITVSKMVDLTKQHGEDDQRVRDEMNELTGIIDSVMHQMTIKEMIEYLKVKLKEREFHTKWLYDAFKFIQSTELAKDMLTGGDRKERVYQVGKNSEMSKLMGYLNRNNKKTE